jgi:hypothetical protein
MIVNYDLAIQLITDDGWLNCMVFFPNGEDQAIIQNRDCFA